MGRENLLRIRPQHMPEPPHCLGRLAGKEMAIRIHSQRDLRAPHDGLNDLGMLAGKGEPGTAGVAQAVEVETLAFEVGRK